MRYPSTAMSVKPRMPTPEQDGLYVASVDKAFRLLSAFGRERAELTLSDLAKHTQMTLPNIQRLTHTLARLGYLARDEATKRYSLTPRTLDIGFRYLVASPLLDRAAPVVDPRAQRRSQQFRQHHLKAVHIDDLARRRPGDRRGAGAPWSLRSTERDRHRQKGAS